MGTGTSIGRVRGLGAAKEGTHHWWRQRLTAGSNFLLMAWFIFALTRISSFDYAGVRSWMESAWVAVPLLLLVTSVFYHFRLGLQVVIEDYQHNESRVVFLVLLNLYVLVVYATAVFSILKVAFGAAS